MELSELPIELQDKILGYLDGVSLARSCQVCVTWQQIIKQPKYLQRWHFLCFSEIAVDMLVEISGLEETELSKKAETSGDLERGIWYDVYKKWYRSRYAGVWPTMVNSLSGHKGPILDVKFFSDKVISASEDGTIRMWDSVTETCIYVFKGHTQGVTSLAIAGPNCLSSSPQSLFLSGSKDSSVRVWSIASLSCLKVLTGHNQWVNAVGVVKDWVVSASDDQTVRVWDLSTGDTIRILTGNYAWVKQIAVYQANLLSASENGTVQLWSIESGTSLFRMEFSHRFVPGLAGLVYRGDLVMALTREGTLKIWNLIRDADYPEESNEYQYSGASVAEYSDIQDLRSSGDTCCSMSLWSNLVAIGTGRGGVLLYHWTETWGEKCPSRGILVRSGVQSINSIDINDDGDGPVVVTGSEDGIVRVHRWFSPHLS